jgi:aminobenzoyl-glutamate utilization protein A
VALKHAAAVEKRRLQHRYTQSAWLEFYATALVAEKLTDWGYEIKMGSDIVDADKRLLLPDSSILAEEYKWALRAGAKEEYLSPAKGGFTGVVGIVKGSKSGPIVGCRFDIDSNELGESTESNHPYQLPVKAFDPRG